MKSTFCRDGVRGEGRNSFSIASNKCQILDLCRCSVLPVTTATF